MPSLRTPPHGATGGEALDLIFIEGYVGHTVIGIHVSELHDTQPLVIDVTAGLPRSRACDTDAIGDTIDYGVVRERLDALMLDHGVTLLEALAERIARILLVDFRAAWVRVKVVKPRKFDNVQSVGVQIERSRADLPRAEIAPVASEARDSGNAAAPRSAQVLHFIGAGMVPSQD